MHSCDALMGRTHSISPSCVHRTFFYFSLPKFPSISMFDGYKVEAVSPLQLSHCGLGLVPMPFPHRFVPGDRKRGQYHPLHRRDPHHRWGWGWRRRKRCALLDGMWRQTLNAARQTGPDICSSAHLSNAINTGKHEFSDQRLNLRFSSPMQQELCPSALTFP